MSSRSARGFLVPAAGSRAQRRNRLTPAWSADKTRSVPESDAIPRHAALLHDRVKKTFRHLRKRFERQRIGAYRLYDWTIPEVRARVDYYAGHVVVAEYERAQTRDLPGYLEALGQAAAEAVGAPSSHVHLKRRSTRQAGTAAGRYGRFGQSGQRMLVPERDLSFWVNLDDFIDTGLFPDHRETRALVRGWARDKSFLNLYCYTGAFSVAAARGGAKRVTSVDLSCDYLDWARDNLRENGLDPALFEFEACDCRDFLERASAAGRTWELVLVDPPSFSTLGAFGEEREFDILVDHVALLEAALAVTAPGGRLIFSTNHQRFTPSLDALPKSLCNRVQEITHRTIPEDFEGRGPFQPHPVHRCFVLERDDRVLDRDDRGS